MSECLYELFVNTRRFTHSTIPSVNPLSLLVFLRTKDKNTSSVSIFKSSLYHDWVNRLFIYILMSILITIPLSLHHGEFNTQSDSLSKGLLHFKFDFILPMNVHVVQFSYLPFFYMVPFPPRT